MKQKILKLRKILNKFTIDDILSMDDFEEQEVSEILSELENSEVISKISAELLVLSPINRECPAITTTLPSSKGTNL